MKTVLTRIVLGIVFSIALVFSNRAFASDTLPSCQYMIWKHGQFICADLDTDGDKDEARRIAVNIAKLFGVIKPEII